MYLTPMPRNAIRLPDASRTAFVIKCVDILELKDYLCRLSHELQVEYFEIVPWQIIEVVTQVDNPLDLYKDNTIVPTSTRCAEVAAFVTKRRRASCFNEHETKKSDTDSDTQIEDTTETIHKNKNAAYCINLPQNVQELATSLPQCPKELPVIIVKEKALIIHLNTLALRDKRYIMHCCGLSKTIHYTKT